MTSILQFRILRPRWEVAGPHIYVTSQDLSPCSLIPASILQITTLTCLGDMALLHRLLPAAGEAQCGQASRGPGVGGSSPSVVPSYSHDLG